MTNAFFSGWSGTGRVIVVGILVYMALVLFLRISGKRTLAKMNAFDLVVTVALGSVLSSTILSRTTPLLDGAVALLLLIALQFSVAWASLRARWFREMVKSRPALLMRDGRFLDDAMRRERIDRDEILAAVRNKGIAALDEVGAVILETDGSFSVLPRSPHPKGETSLSDVPGADVDGSRGSRS